MRKFFNRYLRKKFEILFVNEPQYEYLAAEILFERQRPCQINKEKDNDDLEIQFLSDFYVRAKEVLFKFTLSHFESVLEKAKDELKLCL